MPARATPKGVGSEAAEPGSGTVGHELAEPGVVGLEPAAPKEAARPLFGGSPGGLERAMASQGFVMTPIRGVSMMPLLRQRSDVVVIVPAGSADVRPMDVVLFYSEAKRNYVLHRLISLEGGCAMTLGDNCVSFERFPASGIIGRLSRVYRGEKELPLGSLRYRAYVALWCRPWRARMALIKLRHLAGRAARRLGLRRGGADAPAAAAAPGRGQEAVGGSVAGGGAPGQGA